MQALHSVEWAPDAPAVLLLLHGFGSNERDLPALGPRFAPGLPWASLRAPLTLSRGSFGWFPIVRPGVHDPVAVAVATDELWQWITGNLAPQTRIVAAGFSQGGVMASQLLRTRPERIAATILLSSSVQVAPQPADEEIAASRPPVFWGRGTEDPLLTGALAERTGRWLPAHSSLTERVYPGLAHGINDAEIADVRSFLDGLALSGAPAG